MYSNAFLGKEWEKGGGSRGGTVCVFLFLYHFERSHSCPLFAVGGNAGLSTVAPEPTGEGVRRVGGGERKRGVALTNRSSRPLGSVEAVSMRASYSRQCDRSLAEIRGIGRMLIGCRGVGLGN